MTQFVCNSKKMTREQKESILNQLALISKLANDLALDHEKSIDACNLALS